MKYLKLFDLTSDYQTFIEGEEFVTPNVSYAKDTQISYYNPKVDYSKQYLTFTALEDGMTVSFNKKASAGTLNYSIDGGNTWTELTDTTPSINVGEKIIFKGDLTPKSYSGIGVYSATKNFDASGNIMSLLYGDDFVGQNDLTGKNYAFYYLFSNFSKVVNAKDLILPATTLADGCYRGMFYYCTSLISAPELPATTLAESCYNAMFQNCTSLTTTPELAVTTLASACYNSMFMNCTSLTSAPKLLATTLPDSCYYSMFDGCKSLTNAPELPATTLANYCYYRMFKGCTSLTSAPELPATTLADSCCNGMFSGCTSLTSAPSILPATTLATACYNSMFMNCTSLETAPELPATTLATACYSVMFMNCSSLNYIKMLATDIPSNGCLGGWVSNVSSTGTFVKSAGVDIPTGTNGIPEGWTVQEE